MDNNVLSIEKLNDVHVRVYSEPDIAQELSEYFTFAVPGARFSPAYKNKVWDGKIRLFNSMTKLIYAGLVPYIHQFAKEREYEVEYVNDRFADVDFSVVEAKEFISKLKTLTLEPRDYQLEAFIHAVRKKRALLLSPTASGKSLIIYLLSRFYRSSTDKILIIVPTTSLVHQMTSDFVSYGCDEKLVHKIFSGQEKLTDAPFVITTWQSIYKMPKPWFAQFNCVIGDEAHLFKAKSLTSIMTKLIDCPYKFGFTGTLDGSQTHKLVLEGIFGAVKKVTTTAELIEQKHLSQFKIKAIVLQYEEDIRKQAKNFDYQSEIDYINTNTSRNIFLTKLLSSLEGNTLLLFKIIDHGKTLYDMIQKSSSDRSVFYVDGEVDGLLREEIRKSIEIEKNGIIVASLGTFSTGVNIRNLHNIVFASPSKSRIKTLQSIGRGLRLGENKEEAVLYDIVDDISWKSRKNYTLLHFYERVKMYDDEKFDYKIYNVELRGRNGINS